MGVLNSKLADLHIRKICSGLGLEGIELRKTFMENFPIPILDTPERQLLATQIEALVEEILRIKGGSGVVSGEVLDFDNNSKIVDSGNKTPRQPMVATPQEGNSLVNTTELESQIDALVYQLYDLTAEEVAIVSW